MSPTLESGHLAGQVASGSLGAAGGARARARVTAFLGKLRRVIKKIAGRFGIGRPTT